MRNTNAREQTVREPRDTREPRETRDTRETRLPREAELPAEEAAMRVPPRNRWQILLIEYELLDGYWAALQQRIWMSGLFLVGMSMLGIAFLSVTLKSGVQETLDMILLIGGVASVLTLAWWLLLRRMFGAERVAEYRKNEIERELGMRSTLYLTFLRQSRLFGARRGASSARQLAEGDEEIEASLRQLDSSHQGRGILPKFMAEGLVWNLVPWLLIASWGVLYYIKG